MFCKNTLWYKHNIYTCDGKFIVGKSQPYEYLIDSIKKFHSQDEFLEMIKSQNFIKVSYRSLSGGIVAIHSAWKI